MWFLYNPERLKAEVAGLEDLQTQAPWLMRVTPRLLKDLGFAIDFELVVNDEELPFSLSYPSLFPETPPSVQPRDGRHYSSHQWGTGGELCLEHRADNWDPSVTGAMMVASAYRLLSREGPATEGGVFAEPVPSAHHPSLGQELRGRRGRALLTAGFRERISALCPGFGYRCYVVNWFGPRGTWTAYVGALGSEPAPTWREEGIPEGNNRSTPGLLIRLSSLDDVRVAAQEDLERIINSVMLPEEVPDDATARFAVLADATTARFYCSVFHSGSWTAIPYRTIDVSGDSGGGRLPEHYGSMAARRVGVVGCGSLGTKVATSLARSGVGRFLLVDDDIVLPGNLVRNDLGSDSVAAHKVDALEARLRAVAPGVAVDVSRIALGGQESAGSTATVLDRLGDCDLLVDATADSRAFNFVAAVARRAGRPMIWAEVYAGGVGGFVARLRPNIEPPPHAARRQYLAWCRDQGVPWHAEGDSYEARTGGGVPLVADDGDVGVIAAHAARMAIDVLGEGEVSHFPHPAYVIGLRRGWVFEGPFDTKPLDFCADGAWQLPLSDEQSEGAVEYLAALVCKAADDVGRTDA